METAHLISDLGCPQAYCALTVSFTPACSIVAISGRRRSTWNSLRGRFDSSPPGNRANDPPLRAAYPVAEGPSADEKGSLYFNWRNGCVRIGACLAPHAPLSPNRPITSSTVAGHAGLPKSRMIPFSVSPAVNGGKARRCLCRPPTEYRSPGRGGVHHRNDRRRQSHTNGPRLPAARLRLHGGGRGGRIEDEGEHAETPARKHRQGLVQ